MKDKLVSKTLFSPPVIEQESTTVAQPTTCDKYAMDAMSFGVDTASLWYPNRHKSLCRVRYVNLSNRQTDLQTILSSNVGIKVPRQESWARQGWRRRQTFRIDYSERIFLLGIHKTETDNRMNLFNFINRSENMLWLDHFHSFKNLLHA